MTYNNRQECNGKCIRDLLIMSLGAALILSPWLYGFAKMQAVWNAWISGVAIVIIAAVAAVAFGHWEEWLSLLAGLWTLLSPWLLDFIGSSAAMWSHFIIGLLVAALSGGEIWHHYRTLPLGLG